MFSNRARYESVELVEPNLHCRYRHLGFMEIAKWILENHAVWTIKTAFSPKTKTMHALIPISTEKWESQNHLAESCLVPTAQTLSGCQFRRDVDRLLFILQPLKQLSNPSSISSLLFTSFLCNSSIYSLFQFS